MYNEDFCREVQVLNAMRLNNRIKPSLDLGGGLAARRNETGMSLVREEKTLAEVETGFDLFILDTSRSFTKALTMGTAVALLPEAIVL